MTEHGVAEVGEFSTHLRRGEMVIKNVSGAHPAGARFVSHVLRDGPAAMSGYLAALRAAEVSLPRELTVRADPGAVGAVAISHRWEPGPTLIEIAADEPELFARAVGVIGGWVHALEGTDARIDTNLANFCLRERQPVLIDVVPPLIPSRRPPPMSLFDQLFNALCFDTPVICDALAGYGLRSALRAHHGPDTDSRGAERLLPVARALLSRIEPTDWPGQWFRARAVLAIQTAEGTRDRATFSELFAATSVLGFRYLSEPGRRRRCTDIAHRLRELGLDG